MSSSAVLGGAFFGQAVALQFDIKPVGEHAAASRSSSGLGRFALAVQQQRVDRPARPAGQRDQAFGMRGQLLGRHMRPVARLHLQIGGAEAAW